jgi:hypothetical protein
MEFAFGEAIDAALKPILIHQLEQLTQEVKKGSAANKSVLTGVWHMLYGCVKAVPAAVACAAALEKRKGLVGF